MEDGQSMDGRSWSILPARWTTDRRLAPNDMRVLGALGLYTNQAGVCWPTYETLQRFTKLSRNAVMAAIKRLGEMGYIRHLKPEYYPGQKSKWLTNRYQVLWRGDEPVPRYEDIRDARAINLGQDEQDDRAALAEIAPKSTDQAQPISAGTYTERELEGVAAAFNRALSRYGAFADPSLARSDAPPFLASLAPGRDPVEEMIARLSAHVARHACAPSRLSVLARAP